ncbi:hypothetical protein SRABI128_06493 [Microbacterium sp. Bi128]|nr:hypothetical protein SRABI128_06493 [Microbacterium sp. Bi128]
MGSWEISAISRPLTPASSFSVAAARFRPFHRIWPPVTDTPEGNRPSRDNAVMVLPQPDSPTSPSTVPCSTSKETSVTRGVPASTPTESPRTLSRPAASGAAASVDGAAASVDGAAADAAARRRRSAAEGRWEAAAFGLFPRALPMALAARTVSARTAPVGTISQGAS